jgi:hypothetical protein
MTLGTQIVTSAAASPAFIRSRICGVVMIFVQSANFNGAAGLRARIERLNDS